MVQIGSSEAPRPAARGLPLLRLLGGGLLGAAALTALHVPAGTLIGAVIGSALANHAPVGGSPAALPAPYRVVGLVLLGCVAGVRLDGSTLTTLGRIAIPLTAAVLALVLLNLVLAAVLVRRYSVDPLTAVLACAPGGISELSVAAQEMGARTEVVIAIHAVRVLVVVLLVLPVLVVVLADP